MYYRKEMTATYYDGDINNQLKPSGMLRYMQQTSSEQLVGLNQSPEQLYEQNMVFLLSKSNLIIHRAPTCGERISIGTAAVPPKGARFIREFVIDSLKGERLVSCYSLWILTDTSNHKIMRPNSYPHTIPWEEPELIETVGDIAIPKDIPEGCESWEQEIAIRYSHIDVNAHVNNCAYADFVCDALPLDELTRRGVAKLALGFRKEARHGDTLRVWTTRVGECEYTVWGFNGGSDCFEAYVELRG